VGRPKTGVVVPGGAEPKKMGDLENEIGRLYKRTARTRYEFLKNEVQACRTALEMAEFERSIGNRAATETELAHVAKGIKVIRRFLPLTSAEHQLEIGAKVAEMETALVSLKAGATLASSELN
jgi:hypothetical protein